MQYIDTESLITKEGVFDDQLFRQSAEIVVSKLEKYLADSSIRGLALVPNSKRDYESGTER
jgi:L-2,4-diaminobutyrate decarboxylase